MDCCSCEPVIVLNEEAKRLAGVLKLLFFIYIAIVIAVILVGDFSGFMLYVIIILFLMMTFLQARYQIAGFAIFLVLFGAFNNLVFLGLRIQNKVLSLDDLYTGKNGLFVASIVIVSIAFGMHIVLGVYLFKAYCEFKAISKSAGQGKI